VESHFEIPLTNLFLFLILNNIIMDKLHSLENVKNVNREKRMTTYEKQTQFKTGKIPLEAQGCNYDTPSPLNFSFVKEGSGIDHFQSLMENEIVNHDSRFFFLNFIGDAIEYFIIELKLSRKEVAIRAKISESYLSYIISKKKEPTISTLFKLTHALDKIPFEALFLKAKQVAKKHFNDDVKSKETKDGLSLVSDLYPELEELFFNLKREMNVKNAQDSL
jgi:transcriptional regulator with XRE-family HTH domain